MLPYTTYHIPESPNNQTGYEGKWLQMVVPVPVSGESLALLEKITTALKADFNRETLVLSPDENNQITLHRTGKTRGLVISFGVSPDQLGLWIDLAKPGMCRLESFTFILTLSPESLSTHANAKKELWRCMQIFLESNAA